MTKLQAIAAAVYGPSGNERLSVSVIEGTAKNDIYLTETQSEQIKINSRPAVATRMKDFAAKVALVIGNQKQQTNKPVPLVFGWPAEFFSPDLVENTMRGFGIPSSFMKKETAEPIFITRTQLATPHVRTAKYSQRYMEIFGKLLSKYLQDSLKVAQADFEFRPRAFVDLDLTNDRSISELEAAIASEDRQEWGRVFMNLVQTAEGGDAQARSDLEDIMRHKAHLLVERYDSIAFISGASAINRDSTRFFMTGIPKEPFISDVHLNCFTKLEGLRTVFAEEMIRLMDLDHNICLKAPCDPRNPPFTDVAATYLADQFDELNGTTSRTAVIVKR